MLAACMFVYSHYYTWLIVCPFLFSLSSEYPLHVYVRKEQGYCMGDRFVFLLLQSSGSCSLVYMFDIPSMHCFINDEADVLQLAHQPNLLYFVYRRIVYSVWVLL